jgi:DNA-directed RNA polymerase beta subunit
MSDFVKLSKQTPPQNIEDDDVWYIVDSFFKECGFVSHHIDSYNAFIECDIPKIVEGKILNIEVEGKKCTVEFCTVHLEHPTHRQLNEEIIDIYPKMCIDRDISYLSNIFCDIEFTNIMGSKKIYENINIGAIPVMVKSFLCNLYEISDDKEKIAQLHENLYDHGGYFIINGARKILCNEERSIYNRSYVYLNRKTNPKFDLYVEVRSISVYGSHNTTTCAGMFHKHKTIGVIIPYIENSEIPLCIIFRALGAQSESEIIRYIFGDVHDEEGLEILIPSLEFSNECSSTDMALHYIGRSGKKFTGAHAKKEDDFEDDDDEEEINKKTLQIKNDAVSYAKHLIEAEFLPHIGTDSHHNIEKMFFLGNMVKKLIDVKLKRREPDDRDHEAIKRRFTAGIRLSNLFNNAFKRLCSEITIAIDRCIRGSNAVELKSIIKPNTIKTTMCNAISNNSWGRGKTPGISQEYDCFNYQAMLSNARKDRSQITTEGGKVEKPRHVHGTHWGNECMSDTPEGKQAGLVKNKALSQIITVGSDHFSILEIIQNMNIIKFNQFKSTDDFFKLTKIFLNGNPIGVTRFPTEIQNELLNLRRSGSINYEVSISYDKKAQEIFVMTDAGRTCRPLFIVRDGELLLKKSHIEEIKKGYWDQPPGNTWSKLLCQGFIEIIDKQEEEFSLIAMFPSEIENHPHRYQLTHCELHPCLSYGIGVNLIPFPDHNQCIFEDEPVYMANGQIKKIKDVVVGDVIINFDTKTFSQSHSLVVANYSGPTTKKMYEITTHSGRKIKATYDHRFMTNKGWLHLESIPCFDEPEFSISPTLVGVSLEQINFEKNTSFSSNSSKIPVPVVPYKYEKVKKLYSKIDGVDDFILKTFNLQLEYDDPYPLIRARVIGYCFSGKAKILIEGDCVSFVAKFKHCSDAHMFNEDLKLMGYYSSYISSSPKEYMIRNRDASLIIFLVSCGVEILGHKEEMKIPEFIMKHPQLKIEFIAGYQGGTYQNIKFDPFAYLEKLKFSFSDVVILASNNHIFENQQFRNDIVLMMNEFNVFCDIKDNIHEDGLSSFSYQLCSSKSNIIKYMNTFSYRYNRDAVIDMGIISEYLKAKELSTISESYARWREMIEVSEDGKIIFMPLFSKREIVNPNEKRISDITTLSSFQSFLSGDCFCVHNSPRNAYHSSMGKQAVGIPGSNYMFKTKGAFHVLNYQHKQIVSTKVSRLIQSHHQPAGLNAVLFIGVFLGLNQEDSMIMNQDSIDRGFMVSTAYIPHDAKIRKDKGEFFEVPDEEECSNFNGNVSKLDPSTGIIREGEYVEDGDILIGRTVLVDEENSIYKKTKKNMSIKYEHELPGIVHHVQRDIDGQGYDYVRVVIAQERSPIDGDKFTNTSSQKGVVGYRARSHELPFNRFGIAPDIMVNPLALPSRMTVGKMIEMICGKLVCSTSKLHKIDVSQVFRLDKKDYENPVDEKSTTNPKLSNMKYEDSDSEFILLSEDDSSSRGGGELSEDEQHFDNDFQDEEYRKYVSVYDEKIDNTLIRGQDATPWQKSFSVEWVCSELKKLGLNEFSSERMTYGKTGEVQEYLTYEGICYYQRLKHMVIDKHHARSRGSRVRLTNQPTE